MNRIENILATGCAGWLLATGSGHAETVFWSDDFETNATSRWTTNSMWHVSSPTAGPVVNAAGFRTHSAARCASTQNYPANQDARLICTNYNGSSSFVVPDASQYPRLRFWHWFNCPLDQYGPYALGVVEIKSGTNAWQQISPRYEGSSGVWSRPSLDLQAYAGQSVQIAFHFYTGCCGNGLGWYVDDVAVVTGPPLFNNPESFETGQGDWSVDAGTWEVGHPTSGPNQGHTGTNCAGTVLAGNYGWNMDTRLISPLLSIPASGSPRLHYAQWFSLINAVGFVEVNTGSTASGSTVTNTTITTNVVASGLNTNLYQLSGAAVAGYSTPLSWNQTIGGWTNATKAMGNVFDSFDFNYAFEAGFAPLALVNGANYDYRPVGIVPIPQSAAATNYLAWHGMTWSSRFNGNDNPIGYFATNYVNNYVSNINIVTIPGSNWQTISKLTLSVGGAAVSSGGWTNANLDLSAYAGQTVRVAFHFQSGVGGFGNAAGWYVDDVGLVAAPVLTVPTNALSVLAGKILIATNAATLNPANGTPTFTLLSGPTNHAVLNPTSGVLTWTTTTTQAPGFYTNVIKLTDANGLSATNGFVVTVLSSAPKLLFNPTNALTAGFQFSFQTLTNSTWRIETSSNLSTWLPLQMIVAGTNGTLKFTDLLATNFPLRFYRAVLP